MDPKTPWPGGDVKGTPGHQSVLRIPAPAYPKPGSNRWKQASSRVRRDDGSRDGNVTPNAS